MSKLRTALAVAIALTTTLTIAPSAYSQPLKHNSVVSVVPDASGKFLTISTSLPRPIDAPVIQYFPSADGNSIMVADFYGLKWAKPSALINYPTNDPRIRQIRYGQFQENPPTFRLSVITNNPSYLRQLTFKSTPGTLIVKWPASSKEIAPAPPIGKREPVPRQDLPVGTSFGRGSSLSSASRTLPNYLPEAPAVAPPFKNNSRTTSALPPLKTLNTIEPTIAPTFTSRVKSENATETKKPATAKNVQEPAPSSTEVPNPLKSAQATTSAAFNPVSNNARKLLFTSLARLQDYDGTGNTSPVFSGAVA